MIRRASGFSIMGLSLAVWLVQPADAQRAKKSRQIDVVHEVSIGRLRPGVSVAELQPR